MPLGVGYAALMILGLRTWWIEAVVTPFLAVHWEPRSLLLGGLVGALTSLATIRLTAAALRRLSLQDLLTQNVEPLRLPEQRRRSITSPIVYALWLLAIVSAIAAVYLHGESQAGAFLAAGASVLVALLLHVSQALKRPTLTTAPRRGFSMSQLIMRNLGRNSARSTLTLGLVAMACFLIVAISAFRLRPTEEGTGGFQLLGESDLPVFVDVNDPQERDELLGNDASGLEGTQVIGLRLQPGDDASCRNLYQPQRPRLLGITPAFIAHFDDVNTTSFRFADSLAQSAEQRANPWRLLGERNSDAIPVVLDKNTAMYSLQLRGGVGEFFELDYGGGDPLRFRVVGLLANSVLQGSLLIGEADLLERFPEVAGYRFFLIRTPDGNQAQARQVLEEAWGDEGFVARDTRQVLAGLLAVQNTYLTTFQSLGGLGLLLGTLGLVAVQLRNVFERRSELALLRASGYSQRRLGQLVMGEHLALLLGGLGIGVMAALVAVLPHAWTADVRPPWLTLAWLLSVILGAGALTGYLALRPVVRAPLMDALRSE
jgi:hypothetical protein